MDTKTYQLIFISNYINHHQIPLCNALYRLLEGSFLFIQTEPMEEERLQMGWQDGRALPYLKLYYEEQELCRELIDNCEAALFGGTDDESYIRGRLRAKKPVIRYMERLYKRGQWRAVSPRGLVRKFMDHTRYRRSPVYLLCAGAYVASDFHLVSAYPHKKFCWGYFPETKHYDVDKLLAHKGWVTESGRRIPYVLWAGRFIDWKHLELALETAGWMQCRNIEFHMDIVGGGPLEEQMKALHERLRLEDCVSFVGYRTPEQVREMMEKADVFIQTSDRQEGWGAVINEAMNSACATVMNHMIGAAPYLVSVGDNGFVYKNSYPIRIYRLTERLVADSHLRRRIARNAYNTVTGTWNAENAAKRLVKLMQEKQILSAGEEQKTDRRTVERQARRESRRVWMQVVKCALGMGERLEFEPCMPAPAIPEWLMWRVLTKGYEDPLYGKED